MWYHRGLNSVPQCCRAHVVPPHRSVAASLCAPVPAGGLALSARARIKHVIRATRVTQIPDGTRSGLLRPFLVQFSNAPARVFIDMHVRIVDGGRKWTRRACRSVDRKIDRSTDRFKKDELAAFRQPPRALAFILRRFSFFHLRALRSALAWGSSTRLDWLFSGWSPRVPPGHVLRLSLVLEVNRAATNRVESAEAQQGRFVLARTRSH